ncbi:MAG: DUF4397 domain-containing protein [Fimbriimonadaceae bacterium]|nr:DUF4397 domain-containing protein [Fimbriimonadaceae bacterium]
MRPWLLCGLLLTAADPPAEVRLLHLLPARLPTQVAVQRGAQVLRRETLTAPAVSAWQPLSAGPATVDLRAVDAPEAWSRSALTLPATGRATLVLWQRVGEPAVSLLPDAPPALTAQQTALRLLHAIPDAEQLRLELRRPAGTLWQTERLAPVVPYHEAGPWLITRPGMVTLLLSDPTGEATVLEQAGLRLLPGAAYTLAACGMVAAESDDDLPVQLLAILEPQP